MTTLRTLWSKINEPRVVSIAHAYVYLVLTAVCLYALINPPNSIEGAIGDAAMYLLAGIGATGAALGTPTALAGIWWLERTACAMIMLTSVIYLGVIIGLQVTSASDSNRWLQAGFVNAVLVLHFVRWYRVKQRPYDPDRVTMPTQH